MNPSMAQQIAQRYREKYGESFTSSNRLEDLVDIYILRDEELILDIFNDSEEVWNIDLDDVATEQSVNPQIQEALGMICSRDELEELLDELHDPSISDDDIIEFYNEWQERYYEVLYRDRLNAGDFVHGIKLGREEYADLIKSSEEFYDLQIVDEDGDIIMETSIDAANAIAYASEIKQQEKQEENERSVLQLAADSTAIFGSSINDTIERLRVKQNLSPQIGEAITLTSPRRDASDVLSAFQEMSGDKSRVRGFFNNLRGKYFEVLVRNRLNNGESVGGIQLGEGQRAVLANSPTQEGWDLRILNRDGNIDEYLQLKATKSIGYVNQTLRESPDIRIIVTDEVGEISQHEDVLSAGISNENLKAEINDSIGGLNDSFPEEIAENVLPGAGLFIVIATEGGSVLMGKQTFGNALSRAPKRIAGSVAYTALGAAAIAAGADPTGISALFFAGRLGYSRFKNMKSATDQVNAQTQLLQRISYQRSFS